MNAVLLALNSCISRLQVLDLSDCNHGNTQKEAKK